MNSSPDPRLAAVQNWLRQVAPAHGLDADSLAPASSDASFRRYFRVHGPDGRTAIIMDAPPEHEDCRPFLHVDSLLDRKSVV